MAGDGGAPVASLEPALWRRLSDADSLSDMARGWLALQCQIIEGAARGVVLLADASPNSFEAAAFWPEGSGRSAPLTEVAETALREAQTAK